MEAMSMPSMMASGRSYRPFPMTRISESGKSGDLKPSYLTMPMSRIKVRDFAMIGFLALIALDGCRSRETDWLVPHVSGHYRIVYDKDTMTIESSMGKAEKFFKREDGFYMVLDDSAPDGSKQESLFLSTKSDTTFFSEHDGLRYLQVIRKERDDSLYSYTNFLINKDTVPLITFYFDKEFRIRKIKRTMEIRYY